MESFLEDAFAIIFEQSQDILEYLPQSVPKNPEGLFKPLFYGIKDGMTVEWTPDFGVIWRIRRSSVFEIKSLDKLKKIQKN